MILEGDTWSGSHDRGWEKSNPSLDDIRDAVARLDGRTFTEVVVRTEDRLRYLSVAGGPDLFLVTGELEDASLLHLLSRDQNDSLVSLVCGGQQADFRRFELVQRGVALDAVSNFLNGFPNGIDGNWLVE